VRRVSVSLLWLARKNLLTGGWPVRSQALFPEWNRQFRLVRVHDKRREELGPLTPSKRTSCRTVASSSAPNLLGSSFPDLERSIIQWQTLTPSYGAKTVPLYLPTLPPPSSGQYSQGPGTQRKTSPSTATWQTDGNDR
jgi:hypothetical protein